MPAAEIEERIAAAVKDAEKAGIAQKEVTPYLLKRINELTGGKSLTANIALIKNNARVAAEIAVALARTSGRRLTNHPMPVVLVIGDVMTDIVAKPDGPIAVGADRRAPVRALAGGAGANQACWLAREDVDDPLRRAGGPEDHARQTADSCGLWSRRAARSRSDAADRRAGDARIPRRRAELSHRPRREP